MNDSLLEELCEAADSFHRRGYAHGSTGNLSVRAGDEVWITPTGRSLKGLRPSELARIDLAGASLNEARASKESPFHLAVYEQRPEARAVVHLHAPYSVALSCLEANSDGSHDDADESPLSPLTPYYFMRVAPLAVIPYFRPGSNDLAEAIRRAAPAHHCLLLGNHGTVCAGSTLSEAVDRAEELEQAARLHFILRGERVRHLTAAEIEELSTPYKG
jgi:ribulose-5-phosphate 4-epimerase/fuculose-1-phosphate aldolase